MRVYGRQKALVNVPTLVQIFGVIGLKQPTVTAGGLVYTRLDEVGAKANGIKVTVIENDEVSGVVFSGTANDILVEVEDLSAVDNDAYKALFEAEYPHINVNVGANGADAVEAHSGVLVGGVGEIEGVKSVVKTGTGKYTVKLDGHVRKVLAANPALLADATDSAIAAVVVENVSDLVGTYNAAAGVKLSLRNFAGAAADGLEADYLSLNLAVQGR